MPRDRLPNKDILQLTSRVSLKLRLKLGVRSDLAGVLLDQSPLSYLTLYRGGDGIDINGIPDELILEMIRDLLIKEDLGLGTSWKHRFRRL